MPKLEDLRWTEPVKPDPASKEWTVRESYCGSFPNIPEGYVVTDFRMPVVGEIVPYTSGSAGALIVREVTWDRPRLILHKLEADEVDLDALTNNNPVSSWCKGVAKVPKGFVAKEFRYAKAGEWVVNYVHNGVIEPILARTGYSFKVIILKKTAPRRWVVEDAAPDVDTYYIGYQHNNTTGVTTGPHNVRIVEEL